VLFAFINLCDELLPTAFHGLTWWPTARELKVVVLVVVAADDDVRRKDEKK
jgi:hypothetical protein